MKNYKLNLKSIVQSKARWLITLFAILSLGVGQMWADKTVYFKWSSIPSWYTDIWKVQYWNGSSDVYVAISSAGVADVYKATVADNATGWRICRWNGSNRYNDGAWCSLGTENMLVVTGVAADQSSDKNGDGPYGDKKSSVFGPIGGGYMLFDNSKTQWSDGWRYFVIGHDNGKGYYKTIGSNSGYTVANTLLWCFDANSETWYDAQYFAFLSHDGSYPSAEKKWSDIDTWGANKTSQYTSTFTLKHDSIYLCVPASGTGKPTFTTTRQNGYSALNSTVTLRAKVSTNGGESYPEANTPGDLSASSYKFGAWNSCANTTGTSTTVSAGNASSTFTAGYTANTSVSAAAVTGYDFMGWYEGSTKVLDGRTGTMNPHGAVTLYAYYKLKQYTVSYGVYSSVNGSIKLNSGSAVTSSSSSTLNHGTSITFTATPSSGYQVDGWYSTSACNTTPLQEGGNTYNAGSLSAATTVYVKFKVRTGGTIALSAGTGGEVSADNSSWGTSKSHTNITSNSDLNIYARPTTGYTFNTWTKSSGSGTIKTNAASGVFTPVAYEDATVTASFTETMSSLSTSCSYDAGNPSYSAPTVSGSATTVGYSTTRSITAASASTGYTFVGWTITNGTRTDGGDEDATTITVRSNGDGAAVSVVANYNEVLTSTWKIVGQSTSDKANSPFSNWNYASSTNTMAKASGYSTASEVYATISVAAASVISSDDYYEFKVTSNGTALYGYGENGDDHILFDETKEEQTVYCNSNNDHALRFMPTIAGDYIFKVDYSGTYPKVSVTFPTAYTVTFGASPAAAADAPTNNKSITSGSLVLSGTSVTFTKDATPNSGYTWKGWYDNEEGDGDALGTGNTYTTTISAATTVYAVYTEDMHDVTVNAQTGGTVSYNGGAAGSSCTARAGKATASANIVATASTGYYFVGWQLPDGTITKASESTYNGATSTYTIRATADSKTVTALFNVRYALLGSPDPDNGTGNPEGGMPGWGESKEAPFAYSDGTYTKTVTLTKSNATYKFRIVDRRGATHTSYGLSSKSVIAADGSYHDVASTANDAQLATAGVGTYTLYVQTDGSTSKPKVKISNPTSYLITMGTTTFFNSGASSATATSSTAGGNVTAEDGEDTPNPIVNGNYIKDEGTITFTADPEDGYTFEGWYSNSACSSAITHNGTTIVVNDEDKTLTLSSIGAAKTVYAKFSEIMTTVDLATTGSGKIQYWTGSAWADAPSSESVGKHTTCSLKVVPNTGYYFSGWTRSETPDFHLNGYAEANTNVTLTGDGAGTAGTLTANFVELDKIYFRNIFDDGENEPTRWSDVYVYFHTYWNDTKGAGAKGDGRYYAQMTQIDETDVYWAYVPRAFTTMADATEKKKVGFADHDWHDQNNFRTGNAVNRGDYIHELNMYVPYHTSSGTKSYTDGSAYTTTYFSTGYWGIYDMVVGENVSYYLKNSDNNKDLAQFKAAITGGNIFEATYYINNPNNDMEFRIVSGGGITYDAGGTKITSTNATAGVNMRDWDAAFTIHTSSEGNYTFRISQEGDQMKLTVDYPVSVGDYRIKHSYSDSGTKYAYSDIIKASDSHPTVSMFYNPSSATMVLQKCTTVTASGPVWDGGTAITMTKLNKGAGVYKFDLTISADAGTIDDGAGLYDGPFYIKTDCAPGGWANYTQNVMDKNTINPTAFDYYFMKWLDLDTDNNEKKNIKCVIANQYNNAISDTLKSDGIATMVAGEPVLDNDGSVRFSYNTKTNTLKRAYLTGAAKLTLETYEAEKIYWPSTSSDQYGSHPGFVDDVVWTYELTVDAKLGAKAGVKAAWTNKAGNDKEEMLIANTNPIISGTGSGTYRMRLVFDFKTNSLISSWTPSGDITDKLSDVDVMLVREGQEASDVITFGTGGSLAPRKLVGSLKFEKTTYFGKVASWSETTRPLLTFFVSFPFDVKVSDVFGLNSAYGDAYVIRKYDGADRASKGFFRGDGTTSFWKDLTTEDTMNAYEGYIVVLDNDYFNSDAYSLWGSKSELYLYFPSSKGGTIATGTKTIQVPSHPCTIDRTFDGTKNHMNTDSHWNLIGVPVFTTYDDGGSPAEGTPGAVFAETEGAPDAFNYFYEWDSTRNEFAISAAKNYEFKAMHGYMVQYTGDVTFTGSVFTPASVAARRTVEKKNYDIELQVLNGENEMLNRTYVALREEASNEFVLNEDVYLSPNNRDAEIYTFAGDYDVAANRLPVENQTVRMGLNVHKAGSYTISMPGTFSGTATLVDTYTSTRTNLAIDEYEVNLPKGACDDRFLLELNIHKVPTAIDGVDGGSLKDGNAHKFIMNDRMYILKNGVIYDACGIRVQ